MARIEARRMQQGQQPLQLALWEAPDPDRTNMVALYDIAPRFSFDTREDGEGRRKLIEREFTFGGKRYRITLKPTQLRNADGVVVDKYLGEREQIVEEVIRRIAAKRSRLTLHDGVKVRFPFKISEVREELRRVKHTYSFAEIHEAITLLSEVRLIIQDLDAKGSPVLSAPAFPVMGMRRRGEDGESFVEFNPLVADAIRLLSFQQVDYDILMEIRDPVARWLLKRLHIEMATTRQPVQQLSATDIRRDSGMPEWKQTRNLLRRVSQAADVLVKVGVLDGLDVEEVMEGQRKVDILFTMSASPDFMAKVHASNRIVKDNLAEFSRVTGGKAPQDGFAGAGVAELYRLRSGRAELVEQAQSAK
jgi:hypothetical protein